MGVENKGYKRITGSRKKIAKRNANTTDAQKLRQKSQLKSSDISLGALHTIFSRTPVLPASNMKKADSKAISIIVHISDIAPSLLV